MTQNIKYVYIIIDDGDTSLIDDEHLKQTGRTIHFLSFALWKPVDIVKSNEICVTVRYENKIVRDI